MNHDGMRIDFYRRRLDEAYQRAGFQRIYSKQSTECAKCEKALTVDAAYGDVCLYVRGGLRRPYCFDCAHKEVMASLKPHEAHLLEAFRQMEIVQRLIDTVLEAMNAPGVDEWDMMDRPNKAEREQISRAEGKAEDLSIAAQEVHDALFRYSCACEKLAEDVKPYRDEQKYAEDCHPGITRASTFVNPRGDYP